MKVLTLHQPWASLVALGVKTIETRSWRAPESLLCEPIAIHAAARRPCSPGTSLEVADYDAVWTQDEGWILGHARCDDGTHGAWWPLPLGAIVATAVVVECLPMFDYQSMSASGPDELPERILYLALDRRLLVGAVNGNDTLDVTRQRPLGDFRAGRWAWRLADIAPLAGPVPFRGGQGLSREWAP